jgi:hypothetical protein
LEAVLPYPRLAPMVGEDELAVALPGPEHVELLMR